GNGQGRKSATTAGKAFRAALSTRHRRRRMIDGQTFLRDVTATDAVNFEHVRMAEALLFAAEEPLDEATLAQRLPEGADIPAVIAALTAHYAVRGVNLMTTNGRWWFRTSPDLAPILNRERQEQKKLSRAALETLAI